MSSYTSSEQGVHTVEPRRCRSSMRFYPSVRGHSSGYPPDRSAEMVCKPQPRNRPERTGTDSVGRSKRCRCHKRTRRCQVSQGHLSTSPHVLRPPQISLQRSKPRGRPCVGSVQKLGNARRQVCGTYAYEGFNLHDASE